MRINLGAGAAKLDGYLNCDVEHDIRKLDFPDNSADEIRASHVLEHVSHRETGIVLAEFLRILKPGGLLKIAVPDFSKIARGYASGQGHKFPVEGYLMGGHVDENDRHMAIFDEQKLRLAMRTAGYLRIEKWVSADPDCSSLPVSLNLQCRKPTADQLQTKNIQCVMSVPRLGFMDNFFCAHQLARYGIQLRKVTGAFWGQCLERGIQQCIDDGAEIILTMDYDTVFSDEQLQDLIYTVRSYPEFAVIAPLQVSRSHQSIMMTIKDADGNIKPNHDATAWYDNDVMPVDTAHFGLTAIRVDALKSLPHPWFLGVPAQNGTWGDGRIDDDIYFWSALKKAGHKAALATRVPIGHMELMVRWPGEDMSAIYQTVGEWQENGIPENAWR
jgi:predicted SAM-dependent methyltransferase